jgi:hypothetical protein
LESLVVSFGESSRSYHLPPVLCKREVLKFPPAHAKPLRSCITYSCSSLNNNPLMASPRIFQIPKLGTKLKQDSIPLSYTPRKFITHPTNRYFYLIEGDHRVLGEGAAVQKLDQLVKLSPCQAHLRLLTFSCTASARQEN